MASSEKNPLNGHWTNNVVPLYPRCYDLMIKINQILEKGKKEDERQDKDIDTLFKIVDKLQVEKADKSQVAEAISMLANELYENFYTKEDIDKMVFSTEIVDELPEHGSPFILYLIPETDDLGNSFYEKFVFKDENTPIYLGSSDGVSSEAFTFYMNMLLDSIKNLEDEISGITSGMSGYVTSGQMIEMRSEIVSAMTEMHQTILDEVSSAMTEMHETILGEISDALENYYTKSDVDEQVNEIREEIAGILDDIDDTNLRLSELDDYVHSIPGQVDFEILNERVKVLENKIEDVLTRGIEPTIVTRNITSDKDLLITGVTNVSAKITAPTITIKNGSIEENARLRLVADEDIIVKNIDFVGEFGRREGGNTIMSVNTPGDVSLKYIDFSTPMRGTTYNGIEVGLTDQPKSILIDSINFVEQFENIPLIIYGTQDNTIINIDNLHFGRVRNAIRFSNCLNAKNVVINITNCTCDQWDINTEWSGFIKLQDYTFSAEEVVSNNVFGPDKITINVHNFRYQGVLLEKPEDLAEICGCNQYPQQFIYIWNDNEGFVPYDESRYPTINII